MISYINHRLSWVIVVACALVLPAASLRADPAAGDFQTLVDGPLRDLSQSLQVISTLRAQNAMHKNVTNDTVRELDVRWRQGDTELIHAVMDNDLSSYLTAYAARSGGLYSEIFVIDDKGLNVGQSAVTTDYWQGDEAFFQHAFAGESHVGLQELDESTQKQQIKVSLPVRDEEGHIMGVLAVGVDADRFAAQH